MTGSIVPLPRWQLIDANGAPIVGATIATYVPNTTTPAATFLDQALATPNLNPIVTDATGSFIAWGATDYRYVAHDSVGNLIFDADTSSPLAASVISSFMLPVVGAANSTQFLNLSGTTAAINQAVASVATIVGPTGPAGADSTVPGPTGPTGPQGPGASSLFATVHDATGSRAFNNTYTNSTGVPMFVSVACHSGGVSYQPCSLIVNGVTVSVVWSQDPKNGGSPTTLSVSGMVPIGANYGVTESTWSGIQSWTETY